MKKSLIALAVAGVAVAIPAQAADLKVSGQANVQLVLSNTDDSLKNVDKQTPFVRAGDINVNFAATEEVGFGQAYANVRLDADSLSNGKNGGGNTVTIDKAVVGLKGAFGNVSLGEGEDVGNFGVQTADIQSGIDGSTSEAALTYISPELIPGLVIGVTPIDTQTVSTTNRTTSSAQVGIIQLRAVSNNSALVGTSFKTSGSELGVKYALNAGFGGISTGVGYSSKKTEGSTGNSQRTVDLELQKLSVTTAGVKFTSNVGVHVGVTSSTGEVTTYAVAAGSATDQKVKTSRVEAEVGYTMGPVSAVVVVNNREDKNDHASANVKSFKQDITRVQVDYALSSAAKVRVRNDSGTVKTDNRLATNPDTEVKTGTTFVELQLAF